VCEVWNACEKIFDDVHCRDTASAVGAAAVQAQFLAFQFQLKFFSHKHTQCAPKNK
jgi:hypothetical protein